MSDGRGSQFYVRPGTGPERCPTDLCRDQGNITNVWYMTDVDILLLDVVVHERAEEIRRRANGHDTATWKSVTA